ncbi:aromatic amino acid decarboxylase, putative, partial [Ixodes scapularis]
MQQVQDASRPSQGMDAAEFRVKGCEMVDYIARYLETISERRVTPQCEPGYLKDQLPAKAPDQPEDWDRIMADVERYIMPGVTHWQHPHFHAYFPAGNSYPSILADMLSDGIGCVGFSWAASPACTELEVIMLDWIGKFCYRTARNCDTLKPCPPFLFPQSSASECVLVTLLAARYTTIKKLKQEQPFVDEGVLLSKLMAYCSKEAHSCVEKAAMIGFVKLRILDTDEKFQMRGSVLAAAIEEDRKAGFIPFFVSATLGTTSCCSFDALAEIGPLCQKEGTWLHVDAAYAGSAFICPEFQHLHKGLEQGFRERQHPTLVLKFNRICALYNARPPFKTYFQINIAILVASIIYVFLLLRFKHWGIPLSRRFRSLKLWFVVRRYGVQGLQHYIREHVRLAKKFEKLVLSDTRFEVINEVTFGLVCFRLKGSNQLNMKLLSSINASGKLHMVPASLNDQYVIRFCVCAPNATDDDITYAWDVITQYTTELIQVIGEEPEREEKVSPLPAHHPGRTDLASVTSFASLNLLRGVAQLKEESVDEVFLLDRKQHSLRYKRSFFVRMVSDPKLYNPKIVRALS